MNVGDTMTWATTLVVHDCPSCGVQYGVTKEFEDRRREDGRTFYCPNGHSVVYNGGLSAAQKEANWLKRELETSQRLVASARSDATRNREEAERQARRAAAARGQVTRIKNRIAKGECPCCRETFADLGEHMASQHPDYSEPSSL